VASVRRRPRAPLLAIDRSEIAALVGRGPAPKVAFLYTGQGSQYVNMLAGLRRTEPIVAQTFAEADAVMTPLLGRPLMLVNADAALLLLREQGETAQRIGTVRRGDGGVIVEA